MKNYKQMCCSSDFKLSLVKLNQLTHYIVVEMKYNGHLKYYLKVQLMMLDENNGYTVHVT